MNIKKNIKNVSKLQNPYSLDFENEILVSHKQQLLNTGTTYNVLIGGKWTGKSFPVEVRAIGNMETYPRASVAIGKKYKLNAVDKLTGLINDVTLELKLKGFDLPDYHLSTNKIYRKFGKDPKQWQTVEFFSYENVNGISGITASGLGFYSDVIFEEMVEQGDTSMTREEFNKVLKTTVDTISRSGLNYQRVWNEVPPKTRYWFIMNPWDDFCLIEDAEKISPEQKYLEWVLLDIFNNHTYITIDRKKDISYIRTQKMANPITRTFEMFFHENKITHYDEFLDREEEFKKLLGEDFGKYEQYIAVQIETVYSRIMRAIETNDKFELAILLGLKDESSSNTKTYNLDNWIVMSQEEVLDKDKIKIIGHSVGWDIDQRRKMVGTNILLCEDKEKLEYFIWVDKPEIIKCYGDGYLGENIKNYAEQLKNKTYEMFNKYLKLGVSKPEFGKFLYLDDDKSHYLQLFKNEHLKDITAGKAIKNGRWNILRRQDWMNLAIEAGFIRFHPECHELKREMEKSIRKIGEEQRDERGALEENYDLINMLEYGVFPFRNFLYNKKIGGE